MKRCILSLALCAGLLGGMTAASAASAYDEGIEYQRISPAQPTRNADKIEVVELFWYGCPHCHQLEPELKQWLKNKPADVDFVRLPAILGPSWELMARAFFTAELLGVADETHEALFEIIHKKRDRSIHSIKGLEAFFADHGVDAEKFNATFNSFAVATKLNQARLMTRRYGINGVPTLVVNGKYRTTARIAGADAGGDEVVDHLVAQERKQTAKNADATQP